jgi:RNA recognition motif-containing protein
MEINGQCVSYLLKRMLMTIQVHNLSLNTSDTDLRKLFSVYGVVNSAEVSRDRNNGRSKGNGVINMPIETEALQAITSLNQTLMDGKKITVSELRLPPKW